MKNILSVLFVVLTFVPGVSFAEKYEVGAEQWSFKLITDTCMEQLEEAISMINLPATAIITYPEAIGYRYFSIEIRMPNSTEVSKYELEYWTEYDEQLVCERVEPMDWAD